MDFINNPSVLNQQTDLLFTIIVNLYNSKNNETILTSWLEVKAGISNGESYSRQVTFNRRKTL